MKKLAPLLAFAALTVAALGGAAAVNTGVRLVVALPEGASLAAFEAVEAPTRVTDAAGSPRERASRTAAVSKRDYVQGITCRNIFDSKHPACAEPSVGSEPTAVSDLDATLVATLVAYPPEFSSAFIQSNGGGGYGYGIGDVIGGREIVSIEKKRIALRYNGQIEYLEVSEKVQTTTAAATPAAGESTGSEGIEKIDENKYAVSRDLVDKYMNDLGSISQLGRAIPHRSGGEIDGYRLSGIRRGGVTADLGIKNGDIVHSVNGQALTSMQGAMGAFQSLQSESSFSFEITRRGKKMTLEYDVR